MSKRSKACEIPQKVKEKVWNRDNHQCIICGKYVPKTYANSHFIKRSQGGLGIEQNIVTLCPDCRFNEDFGQDTKLYKQKIENYLKAYYGENWNIENLIYKKY